MNILKKIFKLTPKLSAKALRRKRKRIKGYKAKIDLTRSTTEKIADFLTQYFGNVWFLILNGAWFAFWIPANIGWIPGISIFDPYPFGFLTTAVSLEAIFLAVIVLISQNREANITDLREEIELQINILTEQKIVKIINMLDDVHNHLGLSEKDSDDELNEMKQMKDIDDIEKELLEERINNHE
jgi:uncharacterized membrane protein